MKAVILAGGLGTRLSEETDRIPKPMVEIGGKPILWHIMQIYSAFGVKDFVICLGYRGYTIKEYFANYFTHNSDVTFDLSANKMTVHRRSNDDWRVTLVDTGADTMTGGRLKRIRSYVDDTFCMTYGDGVSDVNIGELISFHKKHGKLATVTGVVPPGRFGVLDIAVDQQVRMIHEKPDNENGTINGGFFVLEPAALDTIEGDATMWEQAPLQRLASTGQLACYQHEGFWQAMDTLREKRLLEDLYAKGDAPWLRYVKAAQAKLDASKITAIA